MRIFRSLTLVLFSLSFTVLASDTPERLIADGRRGVFSPDGGHIAFEAVRDGRLAVGVMRSSGGGTTWVRADAGFAGHPAWTPDGALVYTYSMASNTSFAAVRNKPMDDGANLWLWKDGRHVQLTHGRVFDYGASVAPDGMVWFATSRGEENGTGSKRLCVSHIAACSLRGGEVAIRRHIERNFSAGVMQPCVSPDGRRVLWAEVRGLRTNWRIIVAPVGMIEGANALTAPEYTLTNPHDSSCHSPRWSRDGRKICYTGFRAGDPGWCVYVRDMESGRTRRVCPGENPCFSPDGRSVIYDRGGRLYIRRLDGKKRVRPEFEKIAQVDHWDFGRQYDIESRQGVNDIINHVMRTEPHTLAWRVNGGSMPRHSGEEERVEDLVSPFTQVRIPDGGVMTGHVRLFDVPPAADIYRRASEECETRGLGFCAYWPYEENHWHVSKIGGWNISHPQFWCARTNGTPWIGRCSVAFPEVVAHKLRLLDEILAAGPDTLYIEAWRTGGWSVRDEYVQPNIDVWNARYPGEPLPSPSDKRWVALVAERQYSFFRDIRRHLNASGRDIRFLLGIHDRHGDPDPMYYEKGIDWRRLAKNGIIDGVVIMAYDPDPKRPLESTREFYRSVARDKGACQLFCPVSEYCQTRKRGVGDYARMLGISKQEATRVLLDLAREVKADGILMECVDYNNYTDEMCDELNR